MNTATVDEKEQTASAKVKRVADALLDVELYDYHLTITEARYLAEAAIKAIEADR